MTATAPAEGVCVITTAWNHVDETLACLASIEAQDYPDITILLVDNGSTDNTAGQVRARHPQVEIISLPENLGPTRGYNAGFRRALEKGSGWLFLVNNDTVLAPDCVRQLLAEGYEAADVGLLMPKIYYAAEPERIWSVGGWENPRSLEVIRPGADELDRGQWEQALDLDDIPFCAVMIRRATLEKVGLPDETFFLYYEDRDFSRRAKQAGYRLRLAPAAKVWHAVSTSSGGQDSPQERYWVARSGMLFMRKNARSRRHWLTAVPLRAVAAARTSLRLLRRGRLDSLRAYWRGLWHGLLDLVRARLGRA
ncbi:MAG: glycosyltransferase family 2 protein [Candidatus Promineifilaceae bacterium]